MSDTVLVIVFDNEKLRDLGELDQARLYDHPRTKSDLQFIMEESLDGGEGVFFLIGELTTDINKALSALPD